MPLTPVQSKTYGSSASALSHSVVLTSSPTTNNLLVLAVVSDTTTSGTPTNWSVGASALDFTGTYVYYRIVTAGLSSTITVSLSSSDSCVLQAYEYSSNIASPLDKTASAIAQTTPVSTGTTATTAQADELLFALVGLSNGNGTPPAVTSWSNSFVQLDSTASTASTVNIRAASASLIVSATGTYGTAASLSNQLQGHNSGIIATFKATSGSANWKKENYWWQRATDSSGVF